MKLNISNLLLMILPLSILGTTTINSYQYINHIPMITLMNNQNIRKSLTNMFVNNKLENVVHVGENDKLTSIADSQIISAINQEVALQLSNKVMGELTTQLDYETVVTTLDNKPVPATNDLTTPITLQIIITAIPNSLLIKDKVTLTCNVDYPIFNLDLFLKQGLEDIYAIRHPGEFVDLQSVSKISPFSKSILKVNNIDFPILNKNISTFNYFGESILENNGSIDQTLYTNSWSKTISNQVAIDVSSGVNIGINTIFEVFSVSLDFDFSVQKKFSKGTEETIVATPVPVVVKAHHKTQVLVYLNSFVSSQKVTIDSDINANEYVGATFNFSGGRTEYFSASISDIVNYYQALGCCPQAIIIDNDGTVHVKNEAKFWKYDVGTLWHVIVNDLT